MEKMIFFQQYNLSNERKLICSVSVMTHQFLKKVVYIFNTFVQFLNKYLKTYFINF